MDQNSGLPNGWVLSAVAGAGGVLGALFKWLTESRQTTLAHKQSIEAQVNARMDTLLESYEKALDRNAKEIKGLKDEIEVLEHKVDDLQEKLRLASQRQDLGGKL